MLKIKICSFLVNLKKINWQLEWGAWGWRDWTKKGKSERKNSWTWTTVWWLLGKGAGQGGRRRLWGHVCWWTHNTVHTWCVVELCAPETWIIWLTSVTPINSIEGKKSKTVWISKCKYCYKQIQYVLIVNIQRGKEYTH